MVCLQAGFLPTAAISLVLATQSAFVLQRYFPLGMACTHALVLGGAHCLVAFLIDVHHRTRFLRAAATGSAGPAAPAKDKWAPLHGQ